MDNKDRQVVEYRKSLLDQIETYKNRGMNKIVAIVTVGITKSKYYRWSNSFKKHGSRGLIDNRRYNKEGKIKMTEEQVRYVVHLMKNNSNNLPKIQLYQDYLRYCEIIEQNSVSSATFNRMVNKLMK